VTDSPAGNIAENLVSHFVAADIKQFAPGNVEAAQNWILSSQ
jgi:hypothetical protein